MSNRYPPEFDGQYVLDASILVKGNRDVLQVLRAGNDFHAIHRTNNLALIPNYQSVSSLAGVLRGVAINHVRYAPNDAAKRLKKIIGSQTTLIDFVISFSGTGGKHSPAQMLADATGCKVIGYPHELVNDRAMTGYMFKPQNALMHMIEKKRGAQRFHEEHQITRL